LAILTLKKVSILFARILRFRVTKSRGDCNGIFYKMLIALRHHGMTREKVAGLPRRKRLAMTLVLAIVIAFMWVGVVAEQAMLTQQSISENVLRFHILANSDSSDDQALKLQVRDRVLEYVQNLEAVDLLDKRLAIFKNLKKIEQIASDVVLENGFDYEVAASLGSSQFPTKIYGDISLPTGIYEALRVEIGDAGGANWWCVVYPNICFIEHNAVLSDESKMQLQGSLGDEGYALISGKAPMRFRILEWINR
jgi:stage II sporulation protein R